MLQLIYVTYTHTAKTWLSFCTSTRLHDAVNRLIFRFIRSICTHRNHIHCKDTTQSLLIYTERQQRLCAHAATNIWHSHSHCKGTTQLLCTYTLMQCSKSIDFSIFWAIYMHRKYIHCKDMTQSLLIYTEQQQRFCTYAATNIRHSHSHCKGTTQLLCIYTSERRSKLIDFNFLIDLHASQSHTLQRHDTIFAYIHRTTATSLRTCCN